MTALNNIKLSYFKTIGHEYQWFLLYEFTIENPEIFSKEDPEIIKTILSTRVLNKEVFHEEMVDADIDLEGLGKGPGRPYHFSKLDFSDFKFIKSKVEFQKWIERFRSEGWEDDIEDAQILIDKAEYVLWSRSKIENGIWHLSKDSFNDDSEKLVDFHWIFLHYETFVEIDRKLKTIRTFDFGYD